MKMKRMATRGRDPPQCSGHLQQTQFHGLSLRLSLLLRLSLSLRLSAVRAQLCQGSICRSLPVSWGPYCVCVCVLTEAHVVLQQNWCHLMMPSHSHATESPSDSTANRNVPYARNSLRCANSLWKPSFAIIGTLFSRLSQYCPV